MSEAEFSRQDSSGPRSEEHQRRADLEETNPGVEQGLHSTSLEGDVELIDEQSRPSGDTSQLEPSRLERFDAREHLREVVLRLRAGFDILLCQALDLSPTE